MTRPGQHRGCLSAIQWLHSGALALLGAMFVLAVICTPTAQAQTYKVLHRFHGWPNDGKNPFAGLVRDSVGNLYGTTIKGGAAHVGVVYKLDKTGKETALYSFTGRADGAYPGGLIRDSADNLYGTTYGGGAAGYGEVFKFDTAGIVTVLYSFTGGADGQHPYFLTRDSVGNLYGLEDGPGGIGEVFKLDTAGNVTVLYTFTGGGDGAYPSGLIRDSSGNLYGTTEEGGAITSVCYVGCGVVFKLDTAGTETVLYSFTGGVDGNDPKAGVIRDSAGNLYGTTQFGGVNDRGVVFKLDKTGKEVVLHSFTGGPDGYGPYAGVIRDLGGNLYGTTCCGVSNSGVVFKIDTAGIVTVLYTFTGGADGGFPNGLIRDLAGNLYGTTQNGGVSNSGVVFKIKP